MEGGKLLCESRLRLGAVVVVAFVPSSCLPVVWVMDLAMFHH